MKKAAGFAGACACALAVACGPGAELVGDAAVEAGERLMDAGAALRDGEVARADDGGSLPEPAGDWIDVPCVEYTRNTTRLNFVQRETVWVATLRDDRISIATGRAADVLACDRFFEVESEQRRDGGVVDAGVADSVVVESNVPPAPPCSRFFAAFEDGAAQVTCRTEAVGFSRHSDGSETVTTSLNGWRTVRMRVAAE